MRLLVLLALVASVTAAELPFKQPPAYACDAAFVSDGKKVQGRMVAGGPDKQRIEMKTDDGSIVMILRNDLKKAYMLMVDQKMAMSMPVGAQQGFKDPTRDDKATWKKTGGETVNGVACDRYEWTSGKEKGVTWIDAKQGVMIRVAGADGGTADFTNYQIGAQKAELFEIPAGYQQFGGMMGGQ